MGVASLWHRYSGDRGPKSKLYALSFQQQPSCNVNCLWLQPNVPPPLLCFHLGEIHPKSPLNICYPPSLKELLASFGTAALYSDLIPMNGLGVRAEQRRRSIRVLTTLQWQEEGGRTEKSLTWLSFGQDAGRAAEVLCKPLKMEVEDEELCFPRLLNSSCRRPSSPGPEAVLLHIVLSSVSLLTVTLNLLVIISVSHFRQRWTFQLLSTFSVTKNGTVTVNVDVYLYV